MALLLLTAAPAARAQRVLVQATVANDTLRNAFGPNRRWFGHFYVGYGLVAGPAGTGAAVHYGLPSAELQVGSRLKRRCSQTLALTFDWRYAYRRYALVQNAQKTVPTPAQHRSESLGLHQLQPEIGLRLNTGRRGNVVGHYLDLLAWGSWAFATNHATEADPLPGAKTLDTTETGLAYLPTFGAGTGARLGVDRYALTARYRLTPAWAADYAAWPDLPRWTLGLEIGLF